MTFETEMIKYLREHDLPANEGLYSPELMAQITIRAFEDLFETIEELEEDNEDLQSNLDQSLEQLNVFEDSFDEISLIVYDTKQK